MDFVAMLLCEYTAWSTLIVNDPINIPGAFVLCETAMSWLVSVVTAREWFFSSAYIERRKNINADNHGLQWWRRWWELHLGISHKIQTHPAGLHTFFRHWLLARILTAAAVDCQFFFQINLDFEQTAAVSACWKVLWSRDLYQTCLGFTHTTIQCHLFCVYSIGQHQLSGSAHSFTSLIV